MTKFLRLQQETEEPAGGETGPSQPRLPVVVLPQPNGVEQNNTLLKTNCTNITARDVGNQSHDSNTDQIRRIKNNSSISNSTQFSDLPQVELISTIQSKKAEELYNKITASGRAADLAIKCNLRQNSIPKSVSERLNNFQNHLRSISERIERLSTSILLNNQDQIIQKVIPDQDVFRLQSWPFLYNYEVDRKRFIESLNLRKW